MVKAFPEPPEQVWVARDTRTVFGHRNAECCDLQEKIENICPVSKVSMRQHAAKTGIAKEPATKTQLLLP